MSGQGQFNFVHVIITPLDYECNLVSLQCRKGEARARVWGAPVAEPHTNALSLQTWRASWTPVWPRLCLTETCPSWPARWPCMRT